MNGMRIIPTRMHGMMDYLIGVLLIASPWIFGFANESGTAKWTFIIVGAVILLTSLMTNYELGVMHVVPMHMHLWADAIAGLEDVDFFVKQGVDHLAKLLMMSDKEFNEYLNLIREERKLLRSLKESPEKVEVAARKA